MQWTNKTTFQWTFRDGKTDFKLEIALSCDSHCERPCDIHVLFKAQLHWYTTTLIPHLSSIHVSPVYTVSWYEAFSYCHDNDMTLLTLEPTVTRKLLNIIARHHHQAGWSYFANVYTGLVKKNAVSGFSFFLKYLCFHDNSCYCIFKLHLNCEK